MAVSEVKRPLKIHRKENEMKGLHYVTVALICALLSGGACKKKTKIRPVLKAKKRKPTVREVPDRMIFGKKINCLDLTLPSNINYIQLSNQSLINQKLKMCFLEVVFGEIPHQKTPYISVFGIAFNKKILAVARGTDILKMKKIGLLEMGKRGEEKQSSLMAILYQLKEKPELVVKRGTRRLLSNTIQALKKLNPQKAKKKPALFITKTQQNRLVGPLKCLYPQSKKFPSKVYEFIVKMAKKPDHCILKYAWGKEVNYHEIIMFYVDKVGQEVGVKMFCSNRGKYPRERLKTGGPLASSPEKIKTQILPVIKRYQTSTNPIADEGLLIYRPH